METFTPDWEEWIDLNLRLGNCKKIMFQKSLDQGYSYNVLKNKIGIDYQVDANHAANVEQVALRVGQRIKARNLDIYTIPGFLTSEECASVVALIQGEELLESTTFNAANPNEKQVNSQRTSNTCYFQKDDPLIQLVDSRICKTIGINNRFSEKIQGQKYTVGQEFKAHTDYFDPVVLKENPGIQGQRTWTFMIYLNDVEEGGYTSFPYAYTSVKPRAGTAVIWNNRTAARKENVFSTHCGMPIVAGEKYILTKWFKETEINFDMPNIVKENDYLPVFHPIGFEKLRLPLRMLDALRDWVKGQSGDWVEEKVNRVGVEANMRSEHLDIHTAPKELVSDIEQELKTILTKWIEYKTELVHVATYGVRNYLRGSSLGNHYDKPQSHIVSAIVHLGDTSDKPWELYIEDHTFRPHGITMEYGDIVVYESATCLHGRPTPFEGDSFQNMYVHFKPVRW